ncbi:aldose 1-epimerase [Flavobacteriaceae bacterium MAR_2010_188]|nr:aldose 1-epimerase [Flavobacteriaceae bacterium MAR_2010_188]
MFSTNYSLNKTQTENVLEVSSDTGAYCKINLSLGGSIQELVLDNKTIIKQSEKEYHQGFHSAILFPFPNRIFGGRYSFEGKEYQLPINFKSENNAIHGLVFDKEFKLVGKKLLKDKAVISLRYIEKKPIEGFPYYYTLDVIYMLSSDKLLMELAIKNDDLKTFPFGFGWHPYFAAPDLVNTKLKMDAEYKYEDGKLESCELPTEFEVKEQEFDDCFKLNDRDVLLKTSEYNLKISTSTKDMFVQLYIPESRDAIAIEPMTVAPDSFNNKFGLMELKSKKEFRITYKLEV